MNSEAKDIKAKTKSEASSMNISMKRHNQKTFMTRKSKRNSRVNKYDDGILCPKDITIHSTHPIHHSLG